MFSSSSSSTSSSGHHHLRSTSAIFGSIESTLYGFHDGHEEDTEEDHTLLSKYNHIFNTPFELYAKQHPKRLKAIIRSGVPASIRVKLWIALSKCPYIPQSPDDIIYGIERDMEFDDSSSTTTTTTTDATTTTSSITDEHMSNMDTYNTINDDETIHRHMKRRHYYQLYEKLKSNQSNCRNINGNGENTIAATTTTTTTTSTTATGTVDDNDDFVDPNVDKIRKDVHRTFPNHDYFKDRDGPGQTQLFHILKAYSTLDTQVGYVQGMAFIAGFIVLQTRGDEHVSFWMFVQLLNDSKYGLKDLFRHGLPRLKLLLYTIDRMIQQVLPQMHKHLTNEYTSPEMYASHFILTLCTTKFSMSVTRRIWDLFLSESWIIILQFIISLFHKYQSDILQLTGSEVVSFLYDQCQVLTEIEFMNLMNGKWLLKNVNESLYQKCRLEYDQQQLKQQQQQLQQQLQQQQQLKQQLQQQQKMNTVVVAVVENNNTSNNTTTTTETTTNLLDRFRRFSTTLLSPFQYPYSTSPSSSSTIQQQANNNNNNNTNNNQIIQEQEKEEEEKKLTEQSNKTYSFMKLRRTFSHFDQNNTNTNNNNNSSQKMLTRFSSIGNNLLNLHNHNHNHRNSSSRRIVNTGNNNKEDTENELMLSSSSSSSISSSTSTSSLIEEEEEEEEEENQEVEEEEDELSGNNATTTTTTTSNIPIVNKNDNTNTNTTISPSSLSSISTSYTIINDYMVSSSSSKKNKNNNKKKKTSRSSKTRVKKHKKKNNNNNTSTNE